MQKKIIFIEHLRALAVLAVVTAHTLYEMRHFGAAGEALVGFFNAFPFHYGVDVFFVISGFIMMQTFAARFGEAGAATDFIKRRLLRIVPAYWVFTTVFLLCLWLLPGLTDRAVFDWRHYLTSLFFIPYVSQHQGIAPLLAIGWSLNYEMAFYLLFAVGLLFKKPLGVVFITAGCGLSFIAAHTLLPSSALQQFLAKEYLLIFPLGMLCFAAFARPRFAAVLFVILGGIGAAAQLSDASSHLLKVGMPAAALFLFVMLAAQRFALLSHEGLLSRIGAWSYIIYLSHAFVLEALSLMLRRVFPQGALLTALYVGAVFIAVTAFGALYHKYIDQPMTLRLKRRVF